MLAHKYCISTGGEGGEKRNEVKGRDDREGVREGKSKRTMVVLFYPVTNQIPVKTSLSATEIFCGIMTKLQKKAFV